MAEIVSLPSADTARAFAEKFLLERFKDLRDEGTGWSALCPLCDADTRVGISRELVIRPCANGHDSGSMLDKEEDRISVTASDFFLTCDNKIEWLLEPYVFKGGFTLVQGAPKSGKTWFVAWLAVAIALRGRVAVFVEEEGAREVLRDRLRPFTGDRPPDTLRVMFRQRVRLDNQASVDALIAEVRATKAEFVILDPFIALHGKKEKESDEMSMVLGAIRDLITATGCAVVLVHHTRKGESWSKTSTTEASSEDARGSGALVGDVDNVIAIKGLPTSKRKEGEVRFYVENPDTRVGAPFAKRLMGFELATGTMTELEDTPTGDPHALLERLLPLLPQAPQFISRDKLREALRVRKTQLIDAVEIGRSRGLIVEVSKGRLCAASDRSGNDAGTMRNDGTTTGVDRSRGVPIGNPRNDRNGQEKETGTILDAASRRAGEREES